MTDTILVTGATGFIGSRVAKALLARGERVRLLIRDRGRLSRFLADEAELVAGDVRDTDAVRRAVRGARTVLHLAACARAWSPDRDEYQATNVNAVAALLDAALREDVGRVVHVSTVLATPPFMAACVPASACAPTLYESSKIEAERLVATFVDRGLDVVVVRPTRVYGPGPLDTDANAVTRVVSLYLAGLFRARPDDGDALSSWVHVQDVAEGVILASSRGRTGAAYPLGGQNASFREFLDLVGEIGGVRRRVVAVPARVALTMGRACELWGRIGGRAPLTPGWVRVFLEDRRVDVTLTRADLGYAPRDLRTGLAETIAWLRQHERRVA